MEHKDKLKFLHEIAKLGMTIPHFADGGNTSPGSMQGSGPVGDVLGAAGGFNTALGKGFAIENQYGANLAPTQQFNYAPTMQTASGYALAQNPETQNILAQQQGLANQLQAQTQGAGPNPALAQLAQTTGQNVSGQAALMAGQRGASANAGLMARQAAMQGAGTQQQAVGQAATMRAQQQLNAQAQLIAQQQAMGNLNINSQNANTALFNAAASGNNAQNTGNIANYGMFQGINSGVAQQNTENLSKKSSGLLGSLGGSIGLAEGGEVKHYDDGGGVTNYPEGGSAHPLTSGTPATGGGLISTPQTGQPDSGLNAGSMVSDMMKGKSQDKTAGDAVKDGILGKLGGLVTSLLHNGGPVHPKHEQAMREFNAYFTGGKSEKDVPAMVSPGEIYLSPDKVKKVLQEGANPLTLGHRVKGDAKVKGNSLKNDTVPTMLEEGGCVIPRSVTQAKGMSREKAELFVHRHMARKGLTK